MHYIASLPKIKPLGSGSFGEVFLCNDAAHGHVAAKFYSSANCKSAIEWTKACDDALAEAQNMKALEHRNVVPIYQVLLGPKGDQFLIVMQYCDLGSLSAYASQPVSLIKIKNLIRETSIGLSYIHNKGFIHRDIKPDNIFYTSAGDVKIGDFGFVTDKMVLGFAPGAGTPEYIAPEVLITLKCSYLTDVYSLGVTFLHLIHGDVWFRRSGKKAVLGQVQFNGDIWDTVTDNYAFLPHVPKSWRSVIKRMTHSDPKLRYQSMDACVDAISRLPLVSNWICDVKPESVSWTLIKGKRRWRVIWSKYFTPKENWIAWSENLDGSGRKTMGKSNPHEKSTKHYSSLQKWFTARQV